MSCSLPWLAAVAAAAAAVLAVPSHAAGERDYIDRSPSDQLVWYKLDGRDVRYYILADGRVYPGTMRDGNHVVWHRAEPLLVSEYPYGGPQHRMPLIEARKIDYRTEPLPRNLERVTAKKQR